MKFLALALLTGAVSIASVSMTVASGHPVPRFKPEVYACATDLRAAYAGLLAAMPGTPASAIEVERSLRLSKKLAWQVFRAATEHDPLVTTARAPGPAAFRRVLEAAERAGVDEGVLAKLRKATDRFEQTVSAHADDRSSFEFMVSSSTGQGLATREHDLKRSAYRSNREIHGRYAAVDLSTVFVTPSATPGHVDLTSVRGLIDLYRLRPDANLELARHRFDSTHEGARQRHPLDPSVHAGGDTPISLLTEFTAKPMPVLRQVTSPDGFVRTLVDSETLGLKSGVTCILADRNLANDPRDDNDPDQPGGIGHIHEVATPVRVLLHDAFVHQDLAWNVMPEIRTLDRRGNATRWPGDDSSVLLPIQDRVVAAGAGISAAHTNHWARYPDLVAHVCERIGVDPQQLNLYRCSVDYPILHSVIWMRFGTDQA